MLNSPDVASIRGQCKSSIENLESWIRRLIDKSLIEKYGNEYLSYVDTSENRLIRKGITEAAEQRKNSEPRRYPRVIDALLLEDEIAIVCNPSLWSIFSKSLLEAFPDGLKEARTFLNRILSVRNKLSHSNPITQHEAEQVICYSNDIIGSIQNYYTTRNMEKGFNAPTIIEVSDSIGNTFFESQIKRNSWE